MSCEKVHSVKRGDNGCAFQDHLQINGESVNLSGGTVRAVLRSKDQTVVVNEAATILQIGDDQDRTQANVEWQPLADELDVTEGLYDFEWHTVNSAGKKQTFPRNGYHKIKVWSLLVDY
jgi:hypothetical protein